ncbi:hypothetical protein [Leptolyngbya sp. KIOST-1]|uniref:hypothetical protein n=1 Tax=Leptolyngbya sp. KIOST-1 TaxID=1229172 RepID=UPI000559FA0B|nr:hypothetical protein [Leptolyngbya sp. KIOST-1]
MLRTSSPIAETPANRPTWGQRLRAAVVQFWRFSRFYGDYHSLPPTERRRFVVKRQPQGNPSAPG